MDSTPAPVAETAGASDADQVAPAVSARRESTSQQSASSQTAADILRDQMQLEADAREALPYSIENCTKDLGALRQSVFSCLTCNPPPTSPTDIYNAAGICYACSVQCHGEHQLVEIFAKRNFTCDCGTTRLPAASPCSLRLNSTTNTKGGVHSEEPAPGNKYNQNFSNRFCVCECDYDPFQQKGTMYQCLGLGTHETGGCGEDWYHPGCVMGIGSKCYEKTEGKKAQKNENADEGGLETISEDAEATARTGTGAPANEDGGDDDEETPNPPGFPSDDDFDTFICFKCLESNPWIKRYAGTPGFLMPVYRRNDGEGEPQHSVANAVSEQTSKKRKAGDEKIEDSQEPKKLKSETSTASGATVETNAEGAATDIKEEPKPTTGMNTCKYDTLPPAPEGTFFLFCSDAFREQFCKCAKCFPNLAPYTQLLEEEDTYEPPISENGSDNGQSTNGSGSLYERGESALRNVDRVRAIEGVMAYNQLKDKLKPFFQQFAESGQAISAEDIKEYFAKLRGDEEAIKEAGESAKSDHREEQAGF